MAVVYDDDEDTSHLRHPARGSGAPRYRGHPCLTLGLYRVLSAGPCSYEPPFLYIPDDGSDALPPSDYYLEKTIRVSGYCLLATRDMNDHISYEFILRSIVLEISKKLIGPIENEPVNSITVLMK